MRWWATPLVLALALAVGSCDEGVRPRDVPLRILFLGNSLTAVNNIPSMVEALGRHAGRTIVTGASLVDDASLEDHWVLGYGREALAAGPWDIVVMQQGPSSLTSSAENLVAWSLVWAQAIRAQGGEPALFAVWPDESRAHVFPDVSRHYRAAAEAVDGLFLPAGDAWLAAWQQDPELMLYADGYHPTVIGSLLAALTIYAGVTGEMPDIPAEFTGAFLTLRLPPAQRALLQRSAEEALAQSR